MKEIIKATNLTLSYDGKEKILEDINFEIYGGDLVFITGVSGSGKSTILKALQSILRPYSGRLIINNINMSSITKAQTNKLRQQLGIVFQDYKLIDEWNIKRNIALPMSIVGHSKEVIDKQVDKLLNHVKLTHRGHRLPKELSGGEQQRAGVARALSHNPDIILADEPTGNLDDFSTELVMDLFFKVNKLGKTVVIVTHHMPTNIVQDYRHFHIKDRGIYEYN